MLAQNFKTADDLGITDEQKDALIKTLVLLETGKLTHVSGSHAYSPYRSFSGQFNMNIWHATNHCGSIGCIGGTAEMVGNLHVDSMEIAAETNSALDSLFYPHDVDLRLWPEITTAQAATALRAYLTTGDAQWKLAVAS